MKKLLIALLLSLSLASPAFATDFDMSGQDKVMHVAATTIITAVVYEITDDRIVATVAGLVAGLLKEAADEVRGGEFDTNDLIADGFGIGLGLVYTVEF